MNQPRQADAAPERVTLDDVRASLNPAVKSHFTVAWFGRPIANLVTPAFYNAGWSANGVSLARAALALLGLGALLSLRSWAGAAAAAVFYACFVLDCVDGNIARLRNSVTYWGKYLDGLADSVFVLGAPLAAGTGLWLHGGPAWAMLAGALITIGSLTSQMTRGRLSFMREWMINQSGPVEAQVLERLKAPRRVQAWAAAVLVNGTFFAPLLLLVPTDGPLWYVLALLAVHLAPELVWTATTLIEARILLDRGRRSIHAALR